MQSCRRGEREAVPSSRMIPVIHHSLHGAALLDGRRMGRPTLLCSVCTTFEFSR